METKDENTLVTYKSVHPGEIVADWLEDLGMKQKDFAKKCGMPASRLNELIKGKRDLNADDADKLAEHLGVDAAFWLRLQAGYEYNERMLALRRNNAQLADQHQVQESLAQLQVLYSKLADDVAKIANYLTQNNTHPVAH